jgi:hypothetical protein
MKLDEARSAAEASYRPLGFRAGLASVVWGISAMINIVMLYIGVMQVSVLVNHLHSRPVRAIDLYNNAHRLDLLSGFDWVAFVFGLIVLGLWGQRAYANLRAMGMTGLKYPAGFAGAAFWIPLTSWTVPFTTTREVYQASRPEHDGGDWRLKDAPKALIFWWALSLLRYVLYGIAYDPGKRTWVALLGATEFLTAAAAAGLVFAVGGILFVNRVSSMQKTKSLRRIANETNAANG